MASRNQPSLFDDLATLPPPAAELVELGRRVPSAIKFGTSTWTYDGWAGDVYHRSYRGAQPARRLEEYARYPLFRTVGIDSAYYEPPEEPLLAAYAKALPPGFPCVSKVWDRVTARRLEGERNPDFLNADLFKDAVLAPYQRAFAQHAACFVFEFQPMRGKDRKSTRLNSSHGYISYAVFCLKKKKTLHTPRYRPVLRAEPRNDNR